MTEEKIKEIVETAKKCYNQHVEPRVLAALIIADSNEQIAKSNISISLSLDKMTKLVCENLNFIGQHIG